MTSTFHTPTIRVEYDRERGTLVVIAVTVGNLESWPDRTPRTLGEANEAIKDILHELFVEEYRREHRAAMERHLADSHTAAAEERMP